MFTGKKDKGIEFTRELISHKGVVRDIRNRKLEFSRTKNHKFKLLTIDQD